MDLEKYYYLVQRYYKCILSNHIINLRVLVSLAKIGGDRDENEKFEIYGFALWYMYRENGL